ncbi:MAG: hypothetical protein RIR43_1947, partial [Pseudomonadota bacterium]
MPQHEEVGGRPRALMALFGQGQVSGRLVQRLIA